MRKSILSSVLVLASCGDAAPDRYTVVPVPEEATPVQCEPVEIEGAPSATEIRQSGGASWTLLDAPGREILEFDDRLRVIARTPLVEEGPGAANEPVSVAALGDTAWAVLARGGLRLVFLARDGAELSSLPLDFVPHSMEHLGGDRFLLSAMPFGDKPPGVAVLVEGDRLTPLPAARRSYPDMIVSALGNATLVRQLSDGSALLIHQFMEPRGFRVDPGGGVTSIRVPTPAGTLDAVDYVPTAPITDDQLGRALVPAIALSGDRGRGEVYLLTRSGRELNGRPERALLRLDEDLDLLRAFTLDVPAAGLAYLPDAGMAVVHDDEDRFYTCPLPSDNAT